MSTSTTRSASWEAPPEPDYKTEAVTAFTTFMRDDPKVFAFDTETSGFLLSDRAFCVTVAWEGPDIYDPSARVVKTGYFELEHYNSRPLLVQMFRHRKLIGHNLKFDLHRALQEGLLSRADLHHSMIHDTECLAHLLDEHRPKGLKPLAISVLNEEDSVHLPTEKNPDRRIPRDKHEMECARRALKIPADSGYDVYPRGIVFRYALKDAEFTMRLFRVFAPQIVQYEDLLSLYRQEMELTLVFLDMEARGLGVDLEYVNEKIVSLTDRAVEIESEIEGIVGKPIWSNVIEMPKMKPAERAEFFNPSSNPQLAAYFRAAGHEFPNYDKAVLGSLEHPLAKKLLELRSVLKMRGTYFLALSKGTTTEGVFNPSVRQHGTVTGRTSSGAEKGDS